MNDNNGKVGLGFADVLLIVFIVLKLCHVIEWPWIWVLSPIWITLILIIIIAIIIKILERM